MVVRRTKENSTNMPIATRTASTFASRCSDVDCRSNRETGMASGWRKAQAPIIRPATLLRSWSLLSDESHTVETLCAYIFRFLSYSFLKRNAVYLQVRLEWC